MLTLYSLLAYNILLINNKFMKKKNYKKIMSYYFYFI